MEALRENLSPSEKAELVSLLEGERRGVEFKKCSEAPLYWARNHTKTEDPKWKEHGADGPYQPFPFVPHEGYQEDYFDVVTRILQTEKIVFIPKTREMLTSWLVMIYCTHACEFREGTLVICQTESEDKVKGLIHYASVLYNQQDQWLKDRFPLDGTESVTSISWKNGSRIMGIPHGEHKIRLYHPTCYVMDEVAFLTEAEQCYNSAKPVAQQIIGISSAGPGWFGQVCDPSLEVKDAPMPGFLL